MGLYYEDLSIGDRLTTAGRTIGEYEVSSFAGLTGDYNPMHTDREYARSTAFGGIIAHGALGFAIAVGLMNRTGTLDGTGLAFLGVREWRFTAPILVGDTVHAELEVTELRETSRPDAGIVTRTVELVNQHGDVVQSGALTIMIRRRAESAEAPGPAGQPLLPGCQSDRYRPRSAGEPEEERAAGMSRSGKPLRSSMGWSTTDTITVRGRDLPSELLGHVNLGDMAFLEVMGRLPTEGESAVFNAVAVTLVEHGMTPSAIVARLTYLGAPESIQGAVAAGILGVGSVFVGTAEGSARMLGPSVSAETDPAEIEGIAERLVSEFRESRASIPGIGHPVHKPVDPRVPRLFDLAGQHGFRGNYCALMEAVSAEATRQYDRVLPVNATGAVGALLCELKFDIRVARGIGAMARAVGLVGHIAEEMDTPMASEIWARVEHEVLEFHTGTSS